MKNKIDMCQRQFVDEFGKSRFWLELLNDKFRDLLRPLKNIISTQDDGIVKNATQDTAPYTQNTIEGDIDIRPGDLVRVKPRDVIEAMYHTTKKNSFLRLLPEMLDYSGKTFRVLKEINNYYDQKYKRFLKLRNTVILDGNICRGKKRWHITSCDLSCYIFWRKEWLEKLPK
jgi:hypothetical protein